jgi:N6-adenosine-specific RNA methylase IME4
MVKKIVILKMNKVKKIRKYVDDYYTTRNPIFIICLVIAHLFNWSAIIFLWVSNHEVISVFYAMVFLPLTELVTAHYMNRID